MSWTGWILGSAFLLALYDLAKKASVRDNAVLPTLLCSTLFGCAAFATGCALGGGLPAALRADGRILAFAVVKSVIVATSWVFTFCALRTLPVTIATPIRASAPALVFVIAFFLYGERPGALQGLGMLTVFAGYWAFSWAGRHEGIDFFRSRAVWCAIGGACCSALSSVWDKYIFQCAGAPVTVVQFWFQVGLVIVYATLLALCRAFKVSQHAFEWRWTIPLVGVLLAGADWLYFTGLSFPGVPISVGSLLRRASVVITFVLGARFFHETNLRRKALAMAAIVIGVALLCLGK